MTGPEAVAELERADAILNDAAVITGTLYTRLQMLEASRRTLRTALREGTPDEQARAYRQLVMDTTNVVIAHEALKALTLG